MKMRETSRAVDKKLLVNNNPTMSRDPLTTSGGRAIRYAAMLHLDFRKNSIAPEDPIVKEEGMKISVTVKKNHCDPTKNVYGKVTYFVIFGEGTESILELLEPCYAQGILAKSGAFIREPDETGNAKEVDGIKYQWQGKNAFRTYCKENPEYIDYLISRLGGTGLSQSLSEEEIELIESENKKDKELIGNEMDDIIKEAEKKSKKKTEKKEDK